MENKFFTRKIVLRAQIRRCIRNGGFGMDIGGMGSVYSDYLSTQAAQSNKASALQSKLENSSQNASDEELMDACKEFEAYFVEQLFDTMLESTKMFSDDKDENSYGSKMVDVFKNTALQQLSSQVADSGSIGLARTLYEQMKRQNEAYKIQLDTDDYKGAE